ncbi:MAG: transposase zinc-binding domain-containing protein [Bacteroidetes bacterium]|nr:transposase zinc-binding domain-containing protein [Bacteroidota bacterium]
MTVNEIIRLYRGQYENKYGTNMLPSHQRALDDLAKCRTEEMGTVHWHCNECATEHFSFMPCRNRSCPNCQNNKKIK